MIQLRKMLGMAAAALAVIIYVAKMSELSLLVSFLFAFSLICVFGSYILTNSGNRRIKAIDLLMFAILFLAIAKAGFRGSFDYYKPAIVVLCTVLCFDICPHIKVSAKNRNRILNWFMVAAVFTNVMYYGYGLNELYFKNTNSIALNFTNPNETGMWLVCMIIVLLDGISEKKTKIEKLLILLCGISLVPILMRTQARGSYLALGVYIVLKLVAWFTKMDKLPNWLMQLITLSPVLVYFLYMYIFVPNYDFLKEWFSFLMSEGKSLTSRITTWSILKENFWDFALLGEYDVYHTEQLHNSLGTLCARFGLPFVAIVCKKFAGTLKNLDSVSAQIAISAAWMVGCFETAFFVGVGGLYLLILVLPTIGIGSE